MHFLNACILKTDEKNALRFKNADFKNQMSDAMDCSTYFKSVKVVRRLQAITYLAGGWTLKVSSTLRFSGYDNVLSGYETVTVKRMGVKNQNKRKRRARGHSKLSCEILVWYHLL